MKKTISFVTTCKGRLHHLKETLPLMLAQNPDEVIVVDYDCPDGIGDWIDANHPEIKVIRVSDAPQFHATRARNMGGNAATSDWIVFIDGDVRTYEGWTGWMQENLEPGHFYRSALVHGARDLETFGTVIVNREDFQAIGGYDEAYQGWGGEDIDFYRMLSDHGAVESEYPSKFVLAITHDDAERAGWHTMGDKHQKHVANECYFEAKLQIGRTLGKGNRISLEQRHQLMAQVQSALNSWFEQGQSKPLNLRFTLNRISQRRISDTVFVGSEIALTMTVRNQTTQDA